ncbi:hypothetical protein V3F56_02695 [Moorellaceae bacterium AZ2]
MKDKEVVITFKEFMEGLESVIERTKRIIRLLTHSRTYAPWFRNLWDANGDVYDFYPVAQEISRKVCGRDLSFSDWERAWQYRTVLAVDLKTAREEFANAVVGWS